METKAIETKAEITEAIIRIVDHLAAAQAGSGPVSERRQARDAANAIIVKLPPRWWKKCPAELVEKFTALAQ